MSSRLILPASLQLGYKYQRAEHADSMLARGCVRVGTLGYYRRLGRENTLRGDSREGMTEFVEEQGEAAFYDGLSPFARMTVDQTLGPVARNAVFHGNMFRQQARVPDCFVFCYSLQLSATAADQYDACVRINDRQRFSDLLGRGLLLYLQEAGVPVGGGGINVLSGPVRYEPRHHRGDQYRDVHPAFVKEPLYSRECEYRVLFDIGREPPAPFVDLVVPGLRHLLTPIKIPR